MIELVAADIGGTHARFALAEVAGGRVVRLDQPVTLETAGNTELRAAWQAVGQKLGRVLPRAVALAVAHPNGAANGGLAGDVWSIGPDALGDALPVDHHLLLNDFGAVAHAVQQAAPDHFQLLCGPDRALPDTGVITICGPGTGLGCAQLIRRASGYQVIETEGGHIGFAPADAFEDALVARLRATYGRVSAERVCSGPAIVPIHVQLGGASVAGLSDRVLWQAALDGSDPHAAEALDRFCRILGGVAGDLALAQGAAATVIAGGLGYRLKHRLHESGFAEAFTAKGRFRAMMEAIPVKLITHPQPGLLGAAAAFAQAFE